MHGNPIVIQWFGDQTVAIIELVTAVICFIIILRGLHKRDCFHHDYPKSFKISIYCVYISTIIHALSILSNVVALPIASALYPPSTAHQSNICWGTWVFVLPAFVVMQTSIVNLFIIRLKIAFQHTSFPLSKCSNCSLRLAYPLTMCVIIIVTGFAIKPYPYDIYKKRVDLHGNGVTCSAFVSTEPNPFLALCVGLIGLGLLSAHITVWILFMKRLYKLLKSECFKGPVRSTPSIDYQFIVLMKEQTFIVCVAVFTTVFAWGFQSVVAWGAITAPLDIAVTTFVIFLSFKFNRWYFDALKCGTLTNMCCGLCFERCIGIENFSRYKETKSLNITTITNTSTTSTTSPTDDVSIAVVASLSTDLK